MLVWAAFGHFPIRSLIYDALNVTAVGVAGTALVLSFGERRTEAQ